MLVEPGIVVGATDATGRETFGGGFGGAAGGFFLTLPAPPVAPFANPFGGGSSSSTSSFGIVAI